MDTRVDWNRAFGLELCGVAPQSPIKVALPMAGERGSTYERTACAITLIETKGGSADPHKDGVQQ
jgi:hypothetical protein